MDNYNNTNNSNNTRKNYTYFPMFNCTNPKTGQLMTIASLSGFAVHPRYYPANGDKSARLTFSMSAENRTKSLKYYLGDNIPAPTVQNGSETLWVDVTLWGQTAERAEKVFAKNPRLMVNVFGSVFLRTGNDGNTRINFSAYDFKVEKRLDNPNNAQLEYPNGQGSGSPSNTSAPANNGADQFGMFGGGDFTDISELDEDDELPF